MNLISLIIVLIVVGVLLWLIQRAPFIDARMKTIIFWVVIAFVIVWLLIQFGLLAGLNSIRI